MKKTTAKVSSPATRPLKRTPGIAVRSGLRGGDESTRPSKKGGLDLGRPSKH